MCLELVHQCGVVTHSAAVTHLGSDDTYFMTKLAQRANQFLDMNGLAVLGGGTVMVKDFHAAIIRAACQISAGRAVPPALTFVQSLPNRSRL